MAWQTFFTAESLIFRDITMKFSGGCADRLDCAGLGCLGDVSNRVRDDQLNLEPTIEAM